MLSPKVMESPKGMIKIVSLPLTADTNIKKLARKMKMIVKLNNFLVSDPGNVNLFFLSNLIFLHHLSITIRTILSARKTIKVLIHVFRPHWVLG